MPRRCCTEQADDYEISRARSAHGTCHVHEEDEPADGCRVGSERGQSGSGRRLRLETPDTSFGWEPYVVYSAGGIGRAVRPPEPPQEGEETATRRAPPHCRHGDSEKSDRASGAIVGFTFPLHFSSPLYRPSLPTPVSPSCFCLSVCLGTTLVWYFDLVVVVGWSWCGTTNSWYYGCLFFDFVSSFFCVLELVGEFPAVASSSWRGVFDDSSNARGVFDDAST